MNRVNRLFHRIRTIYRPQFGTRFNQLYLPHWNSDGIVPSIEVTGRGIPEHPANVSWIFNVTQDVCARHKVGQIFREIDVCLKTENRYHNLYE